MGVQELDSKEIMETDGGMNPITALLLGAAIGWFLSQDLDDLADAFNTGYEAGYSK